VLCLDGFEFFDLGFNGHVALVTPFAPHNEQIAPPIKKFLNILNPSLDASEYFFFVLG
tara:strand:+ start:17 stop:190 length:174 start_codon:yes stop_codon:yes gene_type:complete